MFLLRAILNKYWRPHPTKQQLYGHLSPITKTIQLGRIRHAGHCWRSGDELISEYTYVDPLHMNEQRQDDQLRTYILRLCADTGYSFEVLSGAMDNKDGVSREGQRDPCWQHDMIMMMICRRKNIPQYV